MNAFCFLKNHRGTKLKFLKFKDIQGQPLDLRNVRGKNENGKKNIKYKKQKNANNQNKTNYKNKKIVT